jgi:hypothetical protein
MKKPKPTYHFGDKLVLFNKKHLSYPEMVYVVSKDESDYLIKLSIHFPFVVGESSHFFVHSYKIGNYYRHAEKGIQTGLFENCKKYTMADEWREKYLKSK